MKIKYTSLFLIITLTILSFSQAFAESEGDDIYEDGMADTKTQSSDYKYKSNKNYEGKSKYPNIKGKILAEYYVDVLDNSENKVKSGDSLTNSYLKLKTNFKANITKNIYAETDWYLRPVNGRLYSGDHYAKNNSYVVGDSTNSDFYGKEDYIERGFQLSSYGLGIETLNLNYKNSNLAFGLGKINPTFGSAFDDSRFAGVYGTLLPEEYKLTEKIGGYISAIFPFGTLRFNSFFDDTTSLSKTAFNDRGRDNSHGGAGNTEKLNNFSLTFDAKFNDLKLNFGYRQLDTKYSNEDTERGYVAGAEYLFDLGYNVTFLPFAELTYLNNFDGMKDRNMTYFTTLLPVIYENWHFIASSTTKFDDEKGYGNYTSFLNQLSVGYNFDCGLMIDVAKVWERYVRKADDFDNVDSDNGHKWVKHQDSWAFRVSYLYKF